LSSSFLQSFPLCRGEWLLGRAAKCDLVVKEATVSRRHARIVVRDRLVILRDLNSSNGTFVEGKRIDEATLQMGQKIEFGSVAFVLVDQQEDGHELSTQPYAESSAKNSIDSFAAIAHLSDGQQRVFSLLLEGSTEKEIGARIHISPRTVHNHVQAIYKAFGVHSRAKLLATIASKKRARP
jgi:DNA-binding CsgD family transcriptional regulator